jgi:hypothetical protein
MAGRVLLHQRLGMLRMGRLGPHSSFMSSELNETIKVMKYVSSLEDHPLRLSMILGIDIFNNASEPN